MITPLIFCEIISILKVLFLSLIEATNTNSDTSDESGGDDEASSFKENNVSGKFVLNIEYIEYIKTMYKIFKAQFYSL